MARGEGLVFVGRCRSPQAAQALRRRLEQAGVTTIGIRRLVNYKALNSTDESLIAALFGAGLALTAGAAVLIFQPNSSDSFRLGDFVLLGLAGAGIAMLGQLLWCGLWGTKAGEKTSDDPMLTVEVLNRDMNTLEKALKESRD